jgi:hypothetical protein
VSAGKAAGDATAQVCGKIAVQVGQHDVEQTSPHSVRDRRGWSNSMTSEV